MTITSDNNATEIKNPLCSRYFRLNPIWLSPSELNFAWCHQWWLTKNQQLILSSSHGNTTTWIELLSDQSHEGRKRHLLLPFHSKNLTKLAILHDYKHHRMPHQSWQQFSFLKSRVAQGVAPDPHDFKDEMDGWWWRWCVQKIEFFGPQCGWRA